MASRVCWGSTTTLQPPGVTMHRPPALYDICQLLKTQLPDLPGHLWAVLALWVEGTLLALNGCQDAVTLALAHRSRGPAHLHTLRRLHRELLYDDADRIESWGLGQELAMADCFAPLWQRVATGRGSWRRIRAPRAPASKTSWGRWSSVWSIGSTPSPSPGISWRRRPPGLTTSVACCDCWPLPFRPHCRYTCSVTKGWAVAACGPRLWHWGALRAGIRACATRPMSPFNAGPEPARSGALVDHGTGRPVGGHRPGLPRGASGQHFDCIASLRSGAALGAADRHAGGADGAHPVCLP